METYEKGKNQPRSHYGTDMSKTQIFPMSIVKKTLKVIFSAILSVKTSVSL